MKIGASVNFYNYIAVAQKCGFGMGVVCGKPNVIAKPLAEKLDGYSLKEQENCDLIIEGVLEIRKGEMNPRVLEDLLKSRLSPVEREKLVTA